MRSTHAFSERAPAQRPFVLRCHRTLSPRDQVRQARFAVLRLPRYTDARRQFPGLRRTACLQFEQDLVRGRLHLQIQGLSNERGGAGERKLG
jgi:hypothetical protein